MLKTKFDRWLIETFVYEHHIKVVRLPEKIPSGITVSEINSQNYHYNLIAKNRHKADKLIDYLNDSGSAYSTRIVEGPHWYNNLLLNKSKSLTFQIVWWAIVAVICFFLYQQILIFMETDLYHDLRATVEELIKYS